MFSDDYLKSVSAEAESQTDCIEQRAVALLCQRGDMANLDCGGQQAVEGRVRELLLSLEAAP